jgi:hypothetical protein
LWEQEAKVKNGKEPGPLPVNVHEAIEAIATTGKGRCWYCDARLPLAERAISEGWDVQRIDEQPVASIILVCPECVERNSKVVRVRAAARRHRGNARPVLAFEPKRV